ncbi:MAG: glycoside hydrolase family 38 C-terminal domain-containing protein [Eubacteriales bacterium]|nr:glycoside hydrolase family 38 C-terminal domain-containing protein [Eubacteriales bacterium]MDD3197991.1 glycoside hydrolase family 38 C-terminal domain-containing protein [Eubacteriales bacterium]MDD3503956.1 glycoside hydrolase family 38 C-terminal domain-containing protein [Eubacteriales bacterium]MDD4683062.1 glycoside hydrolase family 38 C-terminal domain-containing protein [Eubacteriales bacterium]
MLNEMQNEKMLQKLERLLETADAYFFDAVDSLDYRMFQTSEHLRSVPSTAPSMGRFLDTECFSGEELMPGRERIWGGEGRTCWFMGTYLPRPELRGVPLFVRPRVGGYEAMLWIDGKPAGTFATKIVVTRHGNHYCDLITRSADPSVAIDIAIEFYAGHRVIGCHPFEHNFVSANTDNANIDNINIDSAGFRDLILGREDFFYSAGDIDICVKNQLVIDFALDLRVLLQLARKLDSSSFRRAEIMNVLTEVHKCVLYSPENCDRSTWLRSLAAAREKMRPVLSRRNGDSAAEAALIGHSHMDTAWLWTIDETIRKNARTISNQLSLMRQYPEYKFIQSSAYHMQMMEREYPLIFEEMRSRVAEGRYEPNGAVWIECDCNITSGEALIRQFLWGQRYTREKFQYTADCFWLPDTFGYSAAIPQIMHGCNVKYFLTTKMAWNDTNQFPYETFVWRGLDGSEVITHLFEMDTWPDPAGLIDRLDGTDYKNYVHAKQANDSRLIAFGYGDGGGGPQFEMIETARRLEDLEGCPRVKYNTVSKFMREIERSHNSSYVENHNQGHDQGIIHNKTNLPIYDGELYLELHRGTLTAKQQIKQNNRLSEIALHNLEFLEVLQAVIEGREAAGTSFSKLWETLLVNQFHDILPGTCIALAHDQSIKQTDMLLQEAEKLICVRMESLTSRNIADFTDLNIRLTLINTAGVDRHDVLYLRNNDNLKDLFDGSDKHSQNVTDLDGVEYVAISGVELPAYSVTTLDTHANFATQATDTVVVADHITKASKIIEGGAFAGVDDLVCVTTPFYEVRFDDLGFISSLIDRRVQRELCHGLPLNTFVAAEDVPAAWDGWDIDADCLLKLQPDARLISRGVVSLGCVELRIRSVYEVCSASRIEQDLIFYADSPLITFDTRLRWRDKHRLLKTAFETTIKSRYARCETQFGNIVRPTTRNNSFEQAMFEVCNHKYTDLSEPSYGVSLFNDCKYGIGIDGGNMTLTLAKGGLRPDERGDVGDYRFKYGLLPHIGGFSAENVVLPAYAFNYQPIMVMVRNEVLPNNASLHKTALPINSRSFASADNDNIIIETIKPCEDSDKAYILRLYECEGTAANTKLSFLIEPKKISVCNMLEEIITSAPENLAFRPFEIKTLRVEY